MTVKFQKPAREDVKEIVWDPHLLAMFYAIASKKYTLGQKVLAGEGFGFSCYTNSDTNT